MNTLLARWLNDQRDTLLPRWQALVEERSYAGNGNGQVPKDSSDVAVIPHPAERAVLLTSIYEGLVRAADGEYAQLDECLGLLRAFRTHQGEDELPQQLALVAHLRRLAWGVLFGNRQFPTKKQAIQEWDQLVGELDQLLEYTSVALARQWIASAEVVHEVVQQELHETKLLVESLYHDAEATDRTTIQISNLNQIAQGLAASMDLGQQLEIVGDKLKSTLEVAAVSIWLSDTATQSLHLARDWGAFDDAEVGAAVRVSDQDAGDLLAQAFRSGKLMIEANVVAANQGPWHRPGCAVLVAPLLAQHQVLGVIAIQDPSTNAMLDRSQQEFVRSASSQAAIALENTRLYDEVRGFNSVLEQRIAERTRELQRERDTLETLHQIALETSSTLDRDSLLKASLSALADLVGVEHGSIMLVEPETEHLVDCAVLGRKDAIGYTRFAIGQGIVGWVAQHKKPAIVPDVSKDPRWIALPDIGETRKTLGAMIAVPLIAHHQMLGVLLLSHDAAGYFNEEHLRLLSAAADQISIGINNAQLYTELEKELLHRSEMLGRQESEASQSQAILQSLGDGVIVCGEDGSVLTANLAVERMLDRSIEELVIWNLPELLRRLLGKNADEVPVDALLVNPLDARGAMRTFSTTFELGTKIISITLGPVLNSKDNLIGAVAVFRNITREVESDRLKTEFIGTVSHELRTPMTSIKGFTQLLAMGSLGAINDTQKEFLGIIQTNAERMISIINDLLDITKIETGSVELDLRPLHLAETLSNVMMELQPNTQARELDLAISIPPGLPLLRADAKRLNQILWNLLSNAIKYTPRGGKITLEAREVGVEAVPEDLRESLKPARYALIEIHDTGVGIATEEQEKIFDRFYRTENPLKIEAGGTGLGLSLVRPLILLLNGRVWVRSRVGEGSTFSLVIPAV
jgi:signal transduction histidine kinase/GAF domain-containing protein